MAYNHWASAMRGRSEGYRSGLEDAIAKQIAEHGIPVQYEMFPLKYTVPERLARYTPDFILPNGIVIETKGRFVTADRTKHRLIKEQYPDLDVRFVFSNPNTKIGKKSKTTYGMWCDRLGIPYAAKTIPVEWLMAAPTPRRLKAAQNILGWTPPSS
jgi:hypothetical protein